MKQNIAKFFPSITLKDIFGPNLILNYRASFSNFGWLPKDQAQLDFYTGLPLTIAGDMPVICNSSVITKEVISLIEKGNLPIAPTLHTYRAETDYRNILNKFINEDKKLVFTHIHPPKEVKRNAYWINPQLVGFLNNKSSLEKLVPQGHAPRRIIIPPPKIEEASLSFRFPMVVKAATDEPNGGGYDVSICYNINDIEKAKNHFIACKEVIVEEYLDIAENYCVQFAKTFLGQIVYLGTTEQIINKSGLYLGNWIIKNKKLPNEVVDLGRSIMETASRLGYMGIAGFDIVVTNDNRVLAIDLNFRINGSTAALLLHQSILQNTPFSVLLFRSWKTSANWEKFIYLTNMAIDNLRLIPLAIYNPKSSPYPNAAPLLSGILIGSSKEELLKNDFLLNKNRLL
ncbi:MAG: ATP-grasp domain-containing protein [Bacillota bacterium]|nr:ATP-grasp domain-containing protein [Bacillota bacterium]